MWAAGENHREVLGNPESEGLAKERNRPEGLLFFVCWVMCVRLVHMQVNSKLSTLLSSSLVHMRVISLRTFLFPRTMEPILLYFLWLLKSSNTLWIDVYYFLKSLSSFEYAMPPYGSALRRGEWGSMKELRERDPSGGRLACPVSSRSAWVHSKTLSQRNQNTRKKDERFGKVFLSFSFLSFHSNPQR